jgi:multiple sugar transport system permease protein
LNGSNAGEDKEGCYMKEFSQADERAGDSIRSKRLLNKAFPYLLITPTVILIAVIIVFPVLNVFNLSLQNYSINDPASRSYVGMQNFFSIFTHDSLFPLSLAVTAKWVLPEIVLQLIFGLIVALLLNQTFRCRGFARAVSLVPWAVSGVLTTMLWTMMYDQRLGIINSILKSLGIIHQNVAWLSNQNTFFGAVVLAELWRGIPFFAITLLASLQSVPNEIYESCELDGCGAFKKLVYITLPYLKESIIFTTLLRGIWEFNSIDLIFTMTNGGPMNQTTTLPIYMYKTSLIEGNYGYGSALGVISFFIVLVIAIVYIKISGFGSDEDE